MAIKRPLLAQMVQDALSRKCIREAVLYLVSYIFCLRVPSEALPMIRVGSGENHGQQSEICCKDGRVQLKLLERKNKPEGSLIQRDCWCSKCKVTCPVHGLWPLVEPLKNGTQLFKGVSGQDAICAIRQCLKRLGVKGSSKYTTKAFRRGHARQLADEGASLCTILAAGEWGSKAFMVYQDHCSIERNAVLEAHLAESDDSQGEEGSSESSSDDGEE